MELDVDSIGQELLALWKSEGLHRCSARALDGIAIPDSSKRLLSEFGLPACWGMNYLTDEDQLVPLSEERPDCFVLGSQRVGSRQPHSVYLDVQKGERVLFLSSYGYEDLMNTSVERFAAYLVLHRRLLGEAARLAEQIKGQTPLAPASEGKRRKYALAVEEILDRTEAEMRRLDPLIWEGIWKDRADWCNEEGDDGYWPGVLGEYNEYAMWSAEEVFADWLKAYQ